MRGNFTKVIHWRHNSKQHDDPVLFKKVIDGQNVWELEAMISVLSHLPLDHSTDAALAREQSATDCSRAKAAAEDLKRYAPGTLSASAAAAEARSASNTARVTATAASAVAVQAAATLDAFIDVIQTALDSRALSEAFGIKASFASSPSYAAKYTYSQSAYGGVFKGIIDTPYPSSITTAFEKLSNNSGDTPLLFLTSLTSFVGSVKSAVDKMSPADLTQFTMSVDERVWERVWDSGSPIVGGASSGVGVSKPRASTSVMGLVALVVGFQLDTLLGPAWYKDVERGDYSGVPSEFGTLGKSRSTVKIMILLFKYAVYEHAHPSNFCSRELVKLPGGEARFWARKICDWIKD